MQRNIFTKNLSYNLKNKHVFYYYIFYEYISQEFGLWFKISKINMYFVTILGYHIHVHVSGTFFFFLDFTVEWNVPLFPWLHCRVERSSFPLTSLDFTVAGSTFLCLMFQHSSIFPWLHCRGFICTSECLLYYWRTRKLDTPLLLKNKKASPIRKLPLYYAIVGNPRMSWYWWWDKTTIQLDNDILKRVSRGNKLLDNQRFFFLSLNN